MPLFRTALVTAGLVAGLAAHAHADATVRVVHGIPGRDVNRSFDPVLPVDVLVDGSVCLLKGITFGSVSGPFTLPAGSYRVRVSLASTLAPCSNAPVIDTTVALTDGENAAIVAALTQRSTPTTYAFAFSEARLDIQSGRILVAHAADAPPVTVSLKAQDGAAALFKNIAPGKFAHSPVPARAYQAEVLVASTGNLAIGPLPLTVGSREEVLAFAVGSAESGSLRLITATIPDVH